MATYKRSKSGGSPSEGASNSASPASSVALSNPSSTQGINNNAPKYGTLVPNRIFVGGISSNTSEAELSQLFSKYGNVKATKIIADRAGVSKGYGFVTFESEEEVRCLIQDSNNIVLKERRLNIAPAIKKQPFSRSFDASSPPPATPHLYFHNGVPYTFHNGMAFFPPTTHQPTLAALPPSAEMYQAYGPTQNAAPAPYGTPLLVPAHPPVFMPQNFSYQPMAMTNGSATPFIYTGSGSPNSNSGSPMAGTPENPQLPSPLPPPHFYTQQYALPEAYYSQPIYFSYSYPGGEYEVQDQQNTNDECSSTVSTPHTDSSDRSSNRSPAHSPFLMINNNADNTGARTEVMNNKGQTGKTQQIQTNNDSQVPVVSWQNLKNHAAERELHIRDGRRSFFPIVPPPPPQPASRPEVMLYSQPSYPGNYPSPNNMFPQQQLQQPQIPVVVNPRGQRGNSRGRTRYRDPISNMPIIPKFPTSFNNNNNPSTLNKNFQDVKPIEVNSGRPQRFSNSRGRGGINRGNYLESVPPIPKPTNSFVSSPSPQMMPQPQERQYASIDRPIMMANTAPRWSSPIAPHPLMKRVPSSKRQNGSTPNLATMNNSGGIRLPKKTQGTLENEGDMGGGGDTQPMVQLALPSVSGSTSPEVTSKMQTLSLSS